MLLGLIRWSNVYSQNLVENGDFEQALKTPCRFIFDAQKENISDYFTNWTTPTGGTSDPWFYSDTLDLGSSIPSLSCPQNLKQYPLNAHSGRRCAGMYMSANKHRTPNVDPIYREYIQTRLRRPLQKGKIYTAEIWCRRNPYSGTNSNNLGFYFSTDAIRQPISQLGLGLLGVVPQINFSQIIEADNDWIKLSQCFVAKESYEYLTIGNFYSDVATKMVVAPLPNRDERPYYLLDDVAVFETSLQELTNTGFLGKDTTLCPGQSLPLQLPAIDGVVYQWPDGNQSNEFVINQNGAYAVTAKAGVCIVQDTINVTIEQDIHLPADTTLCWGEQLTLQPDQANSGYVWSDGSSGQTLTVTQSGIYSLTIPSRYCRLSDTTRVNIVDCSVFVPNVFTPNGDGKNDTFAIRYNPEVGARWRVVIYNRWGRLIYQAEPYQNNWTAENCPVGLYYYLLSDVTRQQHIKGWVTIIR